MSGWVGSKFEMRLILRSFRLPSIAPGLVDQTCLTSPDSACLTKLAIASQKGGAIPSTLA